MTTKWSVQQRRVIERVELIGVDAKNRPIVRGKVGTWGPVQEWSVLRNGDPVDVTEPRKPVPS